SLGSPTPVPPSPQATSAVRIATSQYERVFIISILQSITKPGQEGERAAFVRNDGGPVLRDLALAKDDPLALGDRRAVAKQGGEPSEDEQLHPRARRQAGGVLEGEGEAGI